MDIDPLYLALSENNLEDIILPEKNEWEAIRSRDCTDSFTANAAGNFCPKTCCAAHKKHDKREPGLFKEEFRYSECFACVAKPIVATIERVTSTNSETRGSIKELWKTVEMDPCQSIAKFQTRQSTLLQPTEDFER